MALITLQLSFAGKSQCTVVFHFPCLSVEPQTLALSGIFKSAPIWPQVSVSSLQTYMSPILSLHPFDQAASLSRAILPFIGSLT